MGPNDGNQGETNPESQLDLEGNQQQNEGQNQPTGDAQNANQDSQPLIVPET